MGGSQSHAAGHCCGEHLSVLEDALGRGLSRGGITSEPLWEHANRECSPSSDSSSSRCSSSSLPENTLIIFDWDDTLLCSTALDALSGAPDRDHLQELERTAQAILRTASRFGETIIVTNGCKTWVQESSRRFLPGLVPTLNGLTVLSARALYETRYPNDPFSWKRRAFKKILKYKRVEGDLNLVVIGDSQAEMLAAHSAARVVRGHVCLKTVKLVEEPSALQLLGQLRRIAQDLGKIVHEEGSGSRGLEPRRVSAHNDHLVAWACGWSCQDWGEGPPFAGYLEDEASDASRSEPETGGALPAGCEGPADVPGTGSLC